MIQTFEELEISADLKRALSEMGFTSPTPIQGEVIPHILEGRDCLAQAPTGTGKTCAFGIPLVERIDRADDSVQALILCPTRELALQITEELHNIMKFSEGVRILTVYGGQPIQRQLTALKKRPQIIVGTPGRVIDHLNRRSIRLTNLRMLVLDEADEMLNMGFREDIDEILKGAPTEKQTTLFSATMSQEIREISREYQKEPVEIRTKFREQDVPQITQYCVKVKESDKLKVLMRLIDDNEIKLALVFCNTKKRTQEVADALNSYGYNAESLHGDLRQKERDGVMRNYRGGSINLLVATDVAARGIDVTGIEAVINFDVPNDDEYYVHRIGRTARANREGVAYTLANAKQLGAVERFERYTKTKIERLVVSVADKGIDEKKAALTLERLGEPLDLYRNWLYKKLAELNEAGERQYDFSDLAAALLAKSLEGHSAEVSPISDDNSAKRVKRRSDTVRFFMNIGSRDSDEKGVETFLRSRTGLEEDELIDVKLLDNYGFCEVVKGFEDRLSAVNGEDFEGRRIVMEVAGAGRGPRKDSFGSGRDFRPKREGFESGRDFRPKREGFESGRDFRPKREGFESGKETFRPKRESSGGFERKPSFRPADGKRRVTREDFEPREVREFKSSRESNSGFRDADDFKFKKKSKTKSPSQQKRSAMKDKYADKKPPRD